MVEQRERDSYGVSKRREIEIWAQGRKEDERSRAERRRRSLRWKEWRKEERSGQIREKPKNTEGKKNIDVKSGGTGKINREQRRRGKVIKQGEGSRKGYK